MKSILSAFLLSAALLTGCGSDSSSAKQEDPTPGVAAGTIRYTLDGTQVEKAGQATYNPATTGFPQDALVITGTGKGATGGTEYVQVYYNKPQGAADSEYKLVAIYTETPAARPAYTTNMAGTLTKAGTGWSGTFAGSRVDSRGTIVGTITKGEFTQVQP